MPTLSMFYGILIRMNYKDIGQHNLPHFHAFYAEFEAVFGLDGEIIAGEFPRKQASLVKAWTLLREEDLVTNWKLAANGEKIFRIEPLR
ncbi:MAG: DUF4160 domain-containing protein [Defluviitaleaceae bacterium]|nr:DUF4160 domain-containing protein [Defluviitaleaceae bacterium]